MYMFLGFISNTRSYYEVCQIHSLMFGISLIIVQYTSKRKKAKIIVAVCVGSVVV